MTEHDSRVVDVKFIKDLLEFSKKDPVINAQRINTLEVVLTQAHAVPSPLDEIRDAAEMLWVVLASVSGGDWSKQTPEWQEAAAKWRDNYLKVSGQKRTICQPGVV